MGNNNFFRKVAGQDASFGVLDPGGGHQRLINGVFGGPQGPPPATPYFANKTPTLADANAGYQTPISPYAQAAGQAGSVSPTARMGFSPPAPNNPYSK